MVKILVALVVALSILNSSGASPGVTEKVAALVARAILVAALVTALQLMSAALLQTYKIYVYNNTVDDGKVSEGLYMRVFIVYYHVYKVEGSE